MSGWRNATVGENERKLCTCGHSQRRKRSLLEYLCTDGQNTRKTIFRTGEESKSTRVQGEALTGTSTVGQSFDSTQTNVCARAPEDSRGGRCFSPVFCCPLCSFVAVDAVHRAPISLAVSLRSLCHPFGFCLQSFRRRSRSCCGCRGAVVWADCRPRPGGRSRGRVPEVSFHHEAAVADNGKRVT